MLKFINFQDDYKISMGRELFFILSQQEVYRKYQHLTKIKYDFARQFYNNPYETYDLTILFDIGFSFIQKSFNQDPKNFKEYIDKYIENILDEEKFKSLNYIQFNDLVSDPINTINGVYNKIHLGPNDTVMMSIEKTEHISLERYLRRMKRLSKYFIPLEKDLNKNKLFIDNYLKNKLFNINNIIITDYDITLVKRIIFDRNIDHIDYIYNKIEYFYDAVKDSFLFKKSNCTSAKNMIKVMEFIRKFDVKDFKTDIIKQNKIHMELLKCLS